MGIQVLMANGLPLTQRALDPQLDARGGTCCRSCCIRIVSVLMRRDARRLGDLAGRHARRCDRDRASTTGHFGPGVALPPRVPHDYSVSRGHRRFRLARVHATEPERAEIIGLWKPSGAGSRKSQRDGQLVGIARWTHGQRALTRGTGGAT